MGRSKRTKRKPKKTRLGVSRDIVTFVNKTGIKLGQAAKDLMKDRWLDKAILKIAAQKAKAGGRSQITLNDLRLAVYELGRGTKGVKKKTTKNFNFVDKVIPFQYNKTRMKIYRKRSRLAKREFRARNKRR